MRIRVLLAIVGVVCLTFAGVAQRRDAFVASRDHAAIAYTTTSANDAVAQLQRRLDEGSAALTFDPATGYLRSVLEALNVPVESQSLVFSQTSFQAPLITMHNPRAVYFNDSVSVGWVRGGAVLEISAVDSRQGVIFYALDQKAAAKPQLVRNDECLACHLSWDTLGVPGLVMLSTLPRANEQEYANGFMTDHRSPFGERWSGWYVTGNAGARHLGNRPVTPAELKTSPVKTPAAPLATLDGIFDLAGYLTPQSDVVALMVLSHQVRMTNLLTRLGWEARVADGSAAAQARVREAAADVVDYLLFVDEVALTAPMKGSSGFAASFAARGPRDAKGRSLRELELTRRLLRYPCSYMIYSDAFTALPAAAKADVFAGIWRVLSGADRDKKYASLSATDRRALLEILRDTVPGLPAEFKS